MPFAGPVTTPLQGPTAERAPVARLSVNETADEITVKADASASSDPERDSVSYQFDWGDGTSTAYQTTATATHTYDNSGTYTVSVTVRDESGLTDTATRQIGTFRTENREVSLSASGSFSTTRVRVTNSSLALGATASLPITKSNATARTAVSLSGMTSFASVANASAGGTAILLASPKLISTQLAEASGAVDVRLMSGLSAENIATFNDKLEVQATAGALSAKSNATVLGNSLISGITGVMFAAISETSASATLPASPGLSSVAVAVATPTSKIAVTHGVSATSDSIATAETNLVASLEIVPVGNATARPSIDLNANTSLASVTVAIAGGRATILANPDHIAAQIAEASAQTDLEAIFGLSGKNIATFNEQLEVEAEAGRLVTSGRATVRPEVVLETDSIISSTSTLVILRKPELRQVFVPLQKREIIVPDTDDEESVVSDTDYEASAK